MKIDSRRLLTEAENISTTDWTFLAINLIWIEFMEISAHWINSSHQIRFVTTKFFFCSDLNWIIKSSSPQLSQIQSSFELLSTILCKRHDNFIRNNGQRANNSTPARRKRYWRMQTIQRHSVASHFSNTLDGKHIRRRVFIVNPFVCSQHSIVSTLAPSPHCESFPNAGKQFRLRSWLFYHSEAFSSQMIDFPLSWLRTFLYDCREGLSP